MNKCYYSTYDNVCVHVHVHVGEASHATLEEIILITVTR